VALTQQYSSVFLKDDTCWCCGTALGLYYDFTSNYRGAFFSFSFFPLPGELRISMACISFPGQCSYHFFPCFNVLPFVIIFPLYLTINLHTNQRNKAQPSTSGEENRKKGANICSDNKDIFCTAWIMNSLYRNVQFFGNGALGTSPEHSWTFSIV
jgi:hypothetical protein